MDRHVCKVGWICEKHQNREWPHPDCQGPFIPCPFPGCRFVIDGKPKLPRRWLPLMALVVDFNEQSLNDKTFSAKLWVFGSVMWAFVIVSAIAMWRSW